MNNKKVSSRTATEATMETDKDNWGYESSPDLIIGAVKKIEIGIRKKISSISLRYDNDRIFVYISKIEFFE